MTWDDFRRDRSISGGCHQNLPKRQSNQIRIFLSSTFTSILTLSSLKAGEEGNPFKSNLIEATFNIIQLWLFALLWNDAFLLARMIQPKDLKPKRGAKLRVIQIERTKPRMIEWPWHTCIHLSSSQRFLACTPHIGKTAETWYLLSRKPIPTFTWICFMQAITQSSRCFWEVNAWLRSWAC